MLVRPVYHEMETWKLWALMALAVALGLAFATAVGAADGRPKVATPKPLPTEIDEMAKPMPDQDYVGDIETDVGCEIWRILELHRTENHTAAIAAWTQLTAPQEIVVWKWLALGEAAMATGQLGKAEEYLGRAMNLRPDHALVYYFRGVLRMQQASLAVDWSDPPARPGTRLVSLKPECVVPNTKSLYELAATMDFEKAIELAYNMQIDEAIVPSTLRTTSALEPTVGDLAFALGAENFEAKAHNALSYLFLKRGALELAEQHLDHAVAGGLDDVYGYCHLGDEYRARGQNADAMRAYLKATKFSTNKLNTLLNALRSFRDAFN